MEKISYETKEKIAVDLKKWINANAEGSANKASKKLDVSNAYLSNVIRGKYDDLSDDMWRKIQKQVHVASDWLIEQSTRGFKFMKSTYSRAASGSEMIGIVGSAGSGKTEFTKHKYQNYYVISCHEYFTPRTFLEEVLRVLGKKYQGQSLVALMSAVVSILLKVDSPLLIFDEADKLSDKVLYFLISFYNKMEGKCGIVMQATEFLEQRVERGVSRNQKGYNELNSRIGRGFLNVPEPNMSDVTKILNLNGVFEEEVIVKIFNSSEGDLRVIKKKAQAFLDLKIRQSA